MKITIKEKEDGEGYFILADGKCVEFRPNEKFPDYRYLNGVEGAVSTRYLHQSIDGGKMEGETNIVVRSGEGWRDYLVAPSLDKHPRKS